MMLKGTLDTAVGIDSGKTMDKDTTWEGRIIVRLLAQFMVGLEELPLVGTYTRNLTTKQEWPMKD
jgi:hypothetical protein